jgi:hypothetical protein
VIAQTSLPVDPVDQASVDTAAALKAAGQQWHRLSQRSSTCLRQLLLLR